MIIKLFKNILQEDLIQYGLIPELIGRLPVISSLNDFDNDDMMRVLCEPKNSLIKQYQKLFLLEGVVLDFTKGAFNAIIKLAKEKQVGARALRAVLEEKLLNTMFELPDMKGISRVNITEDTILKNKAPIYHKEKKLKSA